MDFVVILSFIIAGLLLGFIEGYNAKKCNFDCGTCKNWCCHGKSCFERRKNNN